MLFFNKIHHELLEMALEVLEVTSGSIFSSLLLGERLEMTPQLLSQIKTTGMLYFFVISGFHFSVLYHLLTRFFAQLVSIQLFRELLVLLCLCLFGAVVGYSIPVFRVVVMRAVLVFASGFRRQLSKKVVLLYIVLGFCFFSFFQKDPTIFSVSFLLSFGAISGIYFFMPQKKQVGAKALFLYQCGVGIAVNAVIAPLLLYFFSSWNPVSIILSVLFAPFISALVELGFIVLAWLTVSKTLFSGFDIVLLLMGSCFATIVRVFTGLLDKATIFSLAVEVKPSLFFLIFYYITLVVSVICVKKWKQRSESIFL